MVIFSQYDSLVSVFVVQRLFMFERIEQAKYIRLETINLINDRHYAVNLSHMYYSHNSNIKYIN